MRVYNQNLPGNYGPLERTRAYWQWLLQRRAFDQLYVALDGPNLWDLDESTTQLVGYAAIKGQAVIELMTVPGRPKAAMELLARIAGEAIEQDRSSVVLHAPAASPLLAIFDEADGWRRDREVFDGEVYMARLVNPLGVLRRLSGEFFRRAAEAQLPRPLELGLSVEGQRYQIEIDRDRAAVAADQLGRSYLRLNVAEFTRLVLGQLDWDQALAEGRLDPSTALARQTGQVLFPPLPLWRPPLDELMA
jgi:predicted acetyltransferase